MKLVEGQMLRAEDGKRYLVVRSRPGHHGTTRLELLACDIKRKVRGHQSFFPFRFGITPDNFGFKRIA